MVNLMLKISIVTVSYNAADTIEQTISSVVNQTYENIEYIIIDGGSTDGTVDIIRKYEDEIAYWVSEPDKGIYDAMNKGIDVATGDYIYFLGADDAIKETSTVQFVANCIADKCYEVYCFSVYMINEYNKEKLIEYKVDSSVSKYPGMPPHQGMFVKCEIAKRIRFDTSYKIIADYKFFLNCYNENNIRIYFYNFPVAYFSINGLSGSSKEIINNEIKRLMNEIYGEYLENPSKGYRYYIKEFFKKVGFLDIAKKMRDYRGWKKHSCTNEKCRWCKH